MKPLRILFAGTPDFAAASLQALLDSSHQVIGVLTQPDRPAGRGRKLLKSPVKLLAEEAGIDVFQPENLKQEQALTYIAEAQPDVMVVVAYGLLVPKPILELPTYGCINVHGSLLPRWRGAAPIQRAIAAGDTHSGVTIMQMETGLDTGPMLLKKEQAITPDTTGGLLHDQLASLGAKALLETLEDLPGYLAKAQTQPEDGITYAHKLSKEDGQIDWSQNSLDIHNLVHAFNPWPVAWTLLKGKRVRIWDAHKTETANPSIAPGTITDINRDGIRVQCGEGALCVTRLQLPDRKAMSIQDLLNGHADLLETGMQFQGEQP